MVCAASYSFVHSGVNLSDIFVEELAHKAATQLHEVVLLYSAVAAPFRRPLLHKFLHLEQIRCPSGQASTLAETSSSPEADIVILMSTEYAPTEVRNEIFCEALPIAHTMAPSVVALQSMPVAEANADVYTTYERMRCFMLSINAT